MAYMDKIKKIREDKKKRPGLGHGALETETKKIEDELRRRRKAEKEIMASL